MRDTDRGAPTVLRARTSRPRDGEPTAAQARAPVRVRPRILPPMVSSGRPFEHPLCSRFRSDRVWLSVPRARARGLSDPQQILVAKIPQRAPGLSQTAARPYPEPRARSGRHPHAHKRARHLMGRETGTRKARPGDRQAHNHRGRRTANKASMDLARTPGPEQAAKRGATTGSFFWFSALPRGPAPC